jgi:hypothetical protein
MRSGTFKERLECAEVAPSLGRRGRLRSRSTRPVETPQRVSDDCVERQPRRDEEEDVVHETPPKVDRLNIGRLHPRTRCGNDVVTM